MELSDVSAVILAGGLGTRVKHLLNDIPKPMAEFGEKPFLEWNILQLKKNGIENIILSTGYLHQKIESYFGDGSKWGLKISYAVESTPLGTGGAVKTSLQKVRSDPYVVINGDSFLEVDYKKLLDFHQEKNADITICAKKVDNRERFGAMLIDKEDKVNSFSEKNNTSSNGWINAGVYVIQRHVFDSKACKEMCSFEHDIIPEFLEKKIFAFRCNGVFFDIGVPESFENATKFGACLKKWKDR